ncbi:MAG: hypothetical protein V4560_13775 [Bacteroidota bacterium]
MSLIPHPTSDAQQYDFIVYYVNIIFQVCPLNDSFQLVPTLAKSDLSSTEQTKAKKLDAEIKKFLESKDYVTIKYEPSFKTGPEIYTLTDTGREAKKAGGHTAYQQEKDRAVQKAAENKAKEDELRIDILVADILKKKWDFKLRWLSLGLSVAAIVISILVYFQKEREQNRLPVVKTDTSKKVTDTVRK